MRSVIRPDRRFVKEIKDLKNLSRRCKPLHFGRSSRLHQILRSGADVAIISRKARPRQAFRRGAIQRVVVRRNFLGYGVGRASDQPPSGSVVRERLGETGAIESRLERKQRAMRPQLVLIPDLLCDGRIFRDQMFALSDVADVWVADITHSATMFGMARSILREAPWDSFAAAGIGLGGTVAMEIYRQLPQRVDGLALIGTDHCAERPGRRAERQRQIELAWNENLRRFALAQAARLPNAPASPLAGEISEMLAAMAMTLGAPVFERQTVARRDRPDYSAVLRAADVPALVLCGRQDGGYPVDVHRAMSDLMPDAVLRVIDDAAHMVTIEAPEAVSAAMAEWLERVRIRSIREGRSAAE